MVAPCQAVAFRDRLGRFDELVLTAYENGTL
jgi:hypothetical protein